MKHLFIINPSAGKYDHTDEIKGMIRRVEKERGIECEIAVTSAPKHATAIVKRAALSGEQYRVYACGGDGTLHEVVNGAVHKENISVTQFPFGSGNDYIKVFTDSGDAFYNFDNLFDCDESLFDVIRCNGEYSMNICSIGLDARIGTSIDKYKRLPLVTGKGAYIISTIVNTVKSIHKHHVVEIDGEVFDGRFTLICVACGRWYGGSFNPLPEAELNDGMLDVVLVKDVSRLAVPKLIKKYAEGRHRELGDLSIYRRCTRVVISCDEQTPVNLDGELMHSDRAEIEVCSKALRFFYPKGLTFESKVRNFEEMQAI